MVRLLLKKQLSEIFRSYFYDAKKNKPRSKASTVSLIVLYVLLMVGVTRRYVHAVLHSVCALPCTRPVWTGCTSPSLPWSAVLLGAFGSVFNTYLRPVPGQGQRPAAVACLSPCVPSWPPGCWAYT